jgi:hypothetical protein
LKDILSLKIVGQPTDTTCGPTCLHALYQYHTDSIPLDRVIEEVPMLESGGTLGVMLGIHALKRGYKATIYTYNLEMFDPSWFKEGINLLEKLQAQKKAKKKEKFQNAAKAYIEFVQLGGRVKMTDLNAQLIRKYLKKNIPILTGLSATYLYNEMREIPETNKPNDLLGRPSGHFVVLNGYNMENRKFAIADPLKDNPFEQHHYHVHADKLICAILLGTLTYDANLLIIEPKQD